MAGRSQLEHVTQEGLTHFVAFFARAPARAPFDHATRALREVYLFEASSKRGSNLYSGSRPLSSKREMPEIVRPLDVAAALIETKSASSITSSAKVRTILYTVTFIVGQVPSRFVVNLIVKSLDNSLRLCSDTCTCR